MSGEKRIYNILCGTSQLFFRGEQPQRMEGSFNTKIPHKASNAFLKPELCRVEQNVSAFCK